ncbi:MAG: alkaline phosphatase family protein [Candidatus Cybelea sp.]
MRAPDFTRYALSLSVAAAILPGCGGSQQPIGSPGALSQAAAHVPNVTSLGMRHDEQRAIQHVIVIVQESRSFDNLFAGYPNADAPTKGLTSTGKYVPLKPISLANGSCDATYLMGRFDVVYDDGKMDGWNLLDAKEPLCPYTRVERSETLRYWDLAKRFALADRMFGSTIYGDFVEQLYLIAGTTKISSRVFVVGPPSQVPWGCDAPPGTTTRVLRRGHVQLGGPFPCFTQFPTMANLLDKANVSWKCYYGKDNRWVLNPFQAIQYVVSGPDRTRNMSRPATNVLTDLRSGHLPAVSWVISPPADSDFPGYERGPKWVNSIVLATEESRYWAHAAVVVIWDDSGEGRFYDNAAPPQITEVGLGVRVPMIVVSPYAKRGYVSHTTYQFGSILKFIEENWHLGSLGSTDKRSQSIGDIFDFNAAAE